MRFELTTFYKVLVFKTSAINQTRPNALFFIVIIIIVIIIIIIII